MTHSARLSGTSPQASTATTQTDHPTCPTRAMIQPLMFLFPTRNACSIVHSERTHGRYSTICAFICLLPVNGYVGTSSTAPGSFGRFLSDFDEARVKFRELVCIRGL